MCSFYSPFGSLEMGQIMYPCIEHGTLRNEEWKCVECENNEKDQITWGKLPTNPIPVALAGVKDMDWQTEIDMNKLILSDEDTVLSFKADDNGLHLLKDNIKTQEGDPVTEIKLSIDEARMLRQFLDIVAL